MAGRRPAMPSDAVAPTAVAASSACAPSIVFAPGVVPTHYVEGPTPDHRDRRIRDLEDEVAYLRSRLQMVMIDYLEMVYPPKKPPAPPTKTSKAPKAAASASASRAAAPTPAATPAAKVTAAARKPAPSAAPSKATAAALLSALAAPPSKVPRSAQPAKPSAATPACKVAGNSATPPAPSGTAAPPRPKKRKAASATPPPKRSSTATATGARSAPLTSVTEDLSSPDDATDTEVVRATTSARPTTSARAAPSARPTTSARPSPDGPPPSRKPPAIHLRTKEGWLDIQRLLECAGVRDFKAKSLASSIRIQVSDSDAHRAATRLFREQQLPYHTYALPEEKLVRAVIRGVPEGIPADHVANLLGNDCYPVESATRITRRGTKEPLPLVLVLLRHEGRAKEIFDMTRFMNLVVSVEPQRRSGRISQCFRCQQFAHSSRNCFAPPRCVKCAGDHATHECPTPRTEPARCVNCSGAHPASYRGCCKFPVVRPTTASTTTTRAPGRPSQPGISYAAVARSAPQQHTAPPTTAAPPQPAPPKPTVADFLSGVNAGELIRAMTSMSEELANTTDDLDRFSVIAASFAALKGAPS